MAVIIESILQGPLLDSVGGLPLPYVLLRDQKTDGTQGGTFTSGAWRTRDLNTEVVDTHGLASISANQITLAAGVWRTLFTCPALNVDGHQSRLENVTDGATLVFGHNTGSGNLSSQSNSMGFGQFTITASKTLELQHQCATTEATSGFGDFKGFTQPFELYSIIELWKVGEA